MKKQNVFVPEIPGKPVHEAYHGIPQDSYIPETKKALESFIKSANCRFTMTSVIQGTKNKMTNPEVSITQKNEIEIQGFKIIPDKWGLDYSFGRPSRFWMHNGNTLDDINLSCDSWLLS